MCYLLLMATGLVSLINIVVSDESRSAPNFILFLADDLGYGDLSVYGHPSQEFGPIDRMAAEGMRFTQMYNAESMCTPSRAAILTGRIPLRYGMIGNIRVARPETCGGLPRSEVTIAELLKKAGYVTGMVGKWNLGMNKFSKDDGYYLPKHYGFDYVGTNIPGSNEWHCDSSGKYPSMETNERCHLYYGSKLLQSSFDIKSLNNLFLKDALGFISDNVNQPFFLYYSFHQVHVALDVGEEFENSSQRGILGDTINEMGASVEKVLNLLRENNLDTNTLVFFLSDNGPHLEMCGHSGSTGGLKGGKTNFYEGGIKSPAIAWWPSKILPGEVSPVLLSTMDIFATFLDLVDPDLIPVDRQIDGKSLKNVILSQNNVSPHKILFFYCSDFLFAVRYKSYKIHFKTHRLLSETYYDQNCFKGSPKSFFILTRGCKGDYIKDHNPPLIFNVLTDPEEKYPLPATDYAYLLRKVHTLILNYNNTIDFTLQRQLNCFSSYVQP